MKPIKRILVATDFSDCAREALDYALSFAERVGAEVDIVHVFERPVYFDVGVAHSLQLRHNVDQWIGEMRQEANRQLDALAQGIRSRMPNVRATMREGSTVEEILKAAQGASADLIIIGTHGRTGLPHVLLGSVAERVVRGAGCPVLTVRPTAAAKKA
jgi:nucleotide-binding universal stress UspA family protein